MAEDAPEIDIPDTEETNAAAVKLQRVHRGHIGRVNFREAREKRRKFEDSLCKNTGWGYDKLQNVMLSNAKVIAAPRLMRADQLYPMNLEIAETVVESYEGGKDANGMYSGEGTAIFKNGHSYKGTWSEGLMHGNGLFTWADGVSYRGPMVQSKIFGRGQIKWPGGNAYDGYVVDGFRHGNGKFVMVMESEEVEDESAVITYEGDWKFGKRHGEGILLYDSDGKQKYEGEWCEDARHGFGTMTYRSGNVYKGEWKAGQLHGQGQMMWYHKNEIYVGGWQNGLQHGKGEHVWLIEVQTGTSFQTMNRYVGEWQNGLRHGTGVFEYADGSRYEGEWVANLKEGTGKFNFPDGSCYKGKFSKDKMLGQHKRPTKVTINPGAAEVVLHIKDLLVDHDNAEEELIKVKNLLVQYMSELKQIFRYYSQPASPEERTMKASSGSQRLGTPGATSLIRLTENQEGTLVENAFAMCMLDFWKFAKDCRIPDPRLTLAEIDRIFILVDRNSQQRNDLASIHNPHKKLVYRHFLEGVVRLADFKYKDLKSTGDRLCHCLYQNILPYACHDMDDEFKGKMESPEARHVIDTYDPHVRKLFTSRCAGRDALSLRTVLEVLKEKKVVADGGKFSQSDVMDCYYRLMNLDAAFLPANRTNADAELILEEFSELLLRLTDKLETKEKKPTPTPTRLAGVYALMFPDVTLPPMPKPMKKLASSQRRLSKESQD